MEGEVANAKSNVLPRGRLASAEEIDAVATAVGKGLRRCRRP